MLRLSELKLPLDHGEADLQRAVLKRLRIPEAHLLEQRLVKRSVDARRQDRIQLIYSVDVRVKGETALLRRLQRQRRAHRAEPAPTSTALARPAAFHRHGER